MGELGLFGITADPEHGGAGLDTYAYALVMEADDFDTRLAEIRERYGLRYPAED